MSDLDQVLGQMLRKFERRARLDDEDRQALLTLPYRVRTFEAHQYIVREGMIATESCLIVDGLAYRQKTTIDGSRQILSVHIPGDFVDLDGSLLRTADHNVQALTRCQVAMVPVQQIIALIDSHPRVGRAMWIDTLNPIRTRSSTVCSVSPKKKRYPSGPDPPKPWNRISRWRCSIVFNWNCSRPAAASLATR